MSDVLKFWTRIVNPLGTKKMQLAISKIEHHSWHHDVDKDIKSNEIKIYHFR